MNEATTQNPELTRFIVSILCRNGQYSQYMAGGINTSGKRANFTPTHDRRKAAPFGKLTAQTLVERLKKDWRLTAQIEAVPATWGLAPYER